MAFEFSFDIYKQLEFKKKPQAYKSEASFMDDCSALLSAYLSYAVLIESRPGHTSGYLSGAFFNEEDTLGYLSAYPDTQPKSPDEVTELFTRYEAQIAKQVALSKKAAGSFRFLHLVNCFKLDAFTAFCILFSFECEFNRGMESGVYLLQQQKECLRPTIGLLSSIYSLIHPLPDFESIQLFQSGCPAANLFTGHISATTAMTEVVLHPHVVAYLTHSEYLGSEENKVTALTMAKDQQLLFCDSQYSELSDILTGKTPEVGKLITLCGPQGCGKKLSLQKLSQQLKQKFILIHFSSWANTPERLAELQLFSLLEGYGICFENEAYEEPAQLSIINEILDSLAPVRPTVVLITQHMRRTLLHPGYLCRKIDYPLPGHSQTIQLWQHFSEAYQFTQHPDWKLVSGKFVLTPGQIKAVLRDAALCSPNKHLDLETLRNSILRNTTTKLTALADKIEPFYTWDDLILDDHSKALLRDVCNRIKYKYKVEEEWGFSGTRAYGNGISILLYGPPGTGKTMSAQVLARELWLPLYRINLAQITSKYIGETAKNLDAIFNEAKGSNVILFFDEADSLFSKRTDIQSSNDKHSNSEISYLLQKIEEFSGISILATNLANHFDEAFRRRIQYMINIHMPSEEQRLHLWEKAFPAAVPMSDDIDFNLLAINLDISGSVIKAAALQAAFYAADEASSVGMRHIVRALRAELQKLGKPEPAIFQMF